MPTDCQSKKGHDEPKQLIKELMDVAEACVLFAEAFDLDIGITRADLNAVHMEWRESSLYTDGSAALQEEASTS